MRTSVSAAAFSGQSGQLRHERLGTDLLVSGDMNGDKVDEGGCVNTLTQYKPTPMAKGNGTHSMIVQIAKA